MIGSQIGAYIIREEIGKGGMSTVYRAYQQNVDRDVAIKVIKKSFVGKEEIFQRFQREARLIARLEHPHILPIYDYDGGHEPPYIVMRLMQYGTLEQLFTKPLQLTKISILLKQISTAIDYAHRQGILHRDIKPSNILFDQEGNAIIADFGIARIIGEQTMEENITEVGVLVGTPNYMAPEQVLGDESVGNRADIYALGVLLFQMLTHKLPYENSNAMGVLLMHVQSPVPRVTEHNPSLPTGLDEVIAKALAKNPVQRYNSALELANEFDQIYKSPSSPDRRQSDSNDKHLPGGKLPDPDIQNRPTVHSTQTPIKIQKNITVTCINASQYSDFIEKNRGGEFVSDAMGTLWEAAKAIINEEKGIPLSRTETTFSFLWGADTALEDDPVRAVKAALKIQDFFKGDKSGSLPHSFSSEKILLDIGIHTGPAILNTTTDTGSITASGATINFASRLMHHAASEILISPSTFNLVRGAFNVEEIARLETRRKRDLVSIFRVIAEKPAAFRMYARGIEGAETEMVDREAEMIRLQNNLLDTIEDQSIHMMTIVGPAGIGKSKLVYEFIHWAETHAPPFKLLLARATPEMQEKPFALLKSLFALQFDIRRSDRPDQYYQKLESGIQDRIAHNSEMAHLLGYLAGFDMSDSPNIKAMANNPQLLSAHARKMVFQWITQLCDVSPILIIFQDIHLADADTLDLLNEIVTDKALKRLMVVNVARPDLYDYRPNWGSGLTFHMRLDLNPLDKRDSQTLLRTILHKVADLPKQFVDTLVERSEGIPFYLEELVKKLLDERVIIKDGDKVWRLEAQRLDRIDVPSTLVGLLQARIDSLLYPEKIVLQRAAVLGNIFYDDAIMALEQVDENHINELPMILKNLVKGGFLNLRERSDFDSCKEYIFASKMVRDVALNSLIRSVMETFNLAAAEWFISISGERVEEFSSQIAQYYARGGDVGNTIEWYLRAAAYARERALPVEARIYYEKVLELIPPQNWDQLWTANLGHNEVLGILGDIKLRNASDNALYSIAKKLKDEGKLAVAHHHAAYTSILLGNPKEALNALELSLQATQNMGDQVTQSLVLSLMLVCYTQLGELKNAETIIEDALGSLDSCQDEKVHVRCLHNISIYYAVIGDYGRAIQLLEKHVEIDKKYGDIIGEANGLGHIGYNYILLGQHDKGRSALEQSLRLTNRIDTPQKRAYDLLNLGLAHWRCTNFDLAQDVIGEAQRYLLDQGDAFGHAVAQTYLGLVFESLGDTTKACENFTSADKALIEIGAAAYSIDAKAGIVRCFLNEGANKEAAKLTVEIWDFIRPTQGKGLEMPILAYLTCSKAFKRIADLQTSRQVLKSGYQVLMQRATQISDQGWRNSFLENVPEHKELIRHINEVP